MNNWAEVLQSAPAIMLYIVVVLFTFRHLQVHFQWNTERWEGLVLTAFLFAEKQGLIEKLTGDEKKQAAIKKFIEEFKKLNNGKEPSKKDLADAALDFARYAWENKDKPKELKTTLLSE